MYVAENTPLKDRRQLKFRLLIHYSAHILYNIYPTSFSAGERYPRFIFFYAA